MAIPPRNGKTVLVTGFNGYIAGVLVQLLLKNGYTIRGTTRRAASAEPLLEGPFAEYKDRIVIYEVPDMTASGAFDECSKDVDGIFHTASPLNYTLTDYESTVGQAVRGTETLLLSALQAGQRLKAVVVTSSMSSVVDTFKPADHVYTERDFAHTSLDLAESLKNEGKPQDGKLLYAASKTAAERAVWKFRDEHKPAFSLTTTHPSIVLGPPVILPSSPSLLCESLQPIFYQLIGAASITRNTSCITCVDVRDVAKQHLWALENPARADGQRYIASNELWSEQATADALRWLYRGTPVGRRIPLGVPGQGYRGYDAQSGEVMWVRPLEGEGWWDGGKTEREMGFAYVGFLDSLRETAKALEPLLAKKQTAHRSRCGSPGRVSVVGAAAAATETK